MKKLLLLLVPLTLGLMVGCSYDDSELRETIEQMQAQIDAQQTLLDALANKLTITYIVQNTDGYTITFSDGTTATIKNGKDGDKGDKGDTGAQGDKGEDGEDGDSFFAEVVVGTTDVTFTLADGTVVVIPLGSGSGSGDTSAEGNKIYYTTSDGKKLFPYNTEPAAFGAILVSNTYEEGQGVLTFDDTITSIGNEAFRDCTSLTSITIPEGVTEIGEYAFRGCTWLKNITIPDSVTSIGEYAFSNCASLTNVTIPDGVTSIKEQTFINCFSLTSVTIGNSVTEIGNYAFDCCSSLTSVTIPNSVISIGKSAFSGCTGKLIINSKIAETDYTPDNYPSDNGWLRGSHFTSLVIGDSVTNIGEYAFRGCTSLTSITIPDSVTSIGRGAFFGCSSLTSVTIPDSVTLIVERAFYNCTSLTSITIPDSVTSIGKEAFSNCASLKSFYGKFASDDNRCLIVDNVLKAFALGCNLEEYTIPDSVTSIGEHAFYGCSSLTSITIPDSVTEIGDMAFFYCLSLTSITIPDSVTSIGWSAFSGCYSLTSVYCKPTTPPSGSYYVFVGNASGRKIYVPTESVKAYKTAEYWSEYAADIVGYDF